MLHHAGQLKKYLHLMAEIFLLLLKNLNLSKIQVSNVPRDLGIQMSKKVTRKKEKHIPQRKRGNYGAPSTEKRNGKKKEERRRRSSSRRQNVISDCVGKRRRYVLL